MTDLIDVNLAKLQKDVAGDVREISANIKHLVDYNKRQDEVYQAGQTELKKELDEIKTDVRKNRTFQERCIGVLLALVFLVPAVEAWLVYNNMSDDTGTASIVRDYKPLA